MESAVKKSVIILTFSNNTDLECIVHTLESKSVIKNNLQILDLA